MTDEHTFPMRESAPTGSPASYDRKSIEELLKSSEPGAVTESGHAYVRFSQAYQRITQRLAQAGHDLNEAWSGTDAAAAQVQMRDLWASSHTISATARDFGTAVERHGSEYLGWYKNSMPQPKTDAEARSWMQGANERITETWTSLPPNISTQLPNNLMTYGAPITPGGSGGTPASGAPAGSGGSAVSGGSSDLSSTPTPAGAPSGSTRPGAAAPSGTSPHSGSAPLVPSTGGGSPYGGRPNTPGSPSGGGGGTDLSGVVPPAGSGGGNSGPPLTTPPTSPSGSSLGPGAGPQPSQPGGPGLGLPGGGAFGPPGRAGLDLPGRTALGLPGGGAGFSQGRPGSEPGGLDRNGVIGRSRLGPPPPPEAGAPGEVPAPRTGPMGMGPMTGAGGSPHGDRERDRGSWLSEDPDVWNEDMQVAPSVLGSEPNRPQSKQGERTAKDNGRKRGGGFPGDGV
ncbi:WXG100 family type VII secretion target [Actinomadura sp. NTSP31]|uniref:WXG100 family type VII secretion target n=1 Tax=Actinomadura sp. NTSP31 TaxID=1735447 RepID=UPI0035BFA1E7